MELVDIAKWKNIIRKKIDAREIRSDNRKALRRLLSWGFAVTIIR